MSLWANTHDKGILERTVLEPSLLSTAERKAERIDGGWQARPQVVLDTTFRVRAVNHAFCEVFLTTREAITGQLVFSLFNEQWNLPELRALLKEAQQEGETRELVLTMVHPNLGRAALRLEVHCEPAAARPLLRVVVDDILTLQEPSPPEAKEVKPTLPPATHLNHASLEVRRSLERIAGTAGLIASQGEPALRNNAEDIMENTEYVLEILDKVLKQAWRAYTSSSGRSSGYLPDSHGEKVPDTIQ